MKNIIFLKNCLHAVFTSFLTVLDRLETFWHVRQAWSWSDACRISSV